MGAGTSRNRAKRLLTEQGPRFARSQWCHRGGSRYAPAMAGIPLHELPEAAQTAWTGLRDHLRTIMRDDLVAMWAHGGTTSIMDPVHAGDLDTYVIVARRPDAPTVRRIEEAQAAIVAAHGIEWDAWYILADDARRSDPPSHAWRERSRDTSWAINRAHWLSGRYVNLYGAEPDQIVPPPTWAELAAELDRELEHVERHVIEGDTDPFEATYAVLTGSRILHALETKNVAVSKRAAGAWALERLPERWHTVLEAALGSYDGHGTSNDARVLASEMAPFVAYVREGLPPAADRPAGALPRWSGY